MSTLITTLDLGDIVTAGVTWSTGKGSYVLTIMTPRDRIVLDVPDDVLTIAGLAEALRHVVSQLDNDTLPRWSPVASDATRESVLATVNEPETGMEVHADEPGGDE